jgi:glycine/sarcosine N-methyltransferase
VSPESTWTLAFMQMDMRDLSKRFAPASFDAILCFGNTLVHLEKRSDVLSLCRAVKGLLKQGGRFLLQILNYDHILSARLPGLPAIDNDRVHFARIYHYNDDGSITFRTILTIRASGSVLEAEVPLYPLPKGVVLALLRDAGFSEILVYGDFRRGQLAPQSLPLVVEAREAPADCTT